MKKHCRQAPYGKGEKTVVDTRVRRVWQLDPDRFSLINPDWQQFLSETVHAILTLDKLLAAPPAAASPPASPPPPAGLPKEVALPRPAVTTPAGATAAPVRLFLATQSPGDLDYRCRDQVLTWLVGRVKESVAINKLKPMFDARRVDAAAKLPGQEAGQFYLVRETDVTPIRADRNLIPTTQLPEDRVLAAARQRVSLAPV